MTDLELSVPNILEPLICRLSVTYPVVAELTLTITLLEGVKPRLPMLVVELIVWEAYAPDAAAQIARIRHALRMDLFILRSL
jgi:hypothetical protein